MDLSAHLTRNKIWRKILNIIKNLETISGINNARDARWVNPQRMGSTMTDFNSWNRVHDSVPNIYDRLLRAVETDNG
jgi:hypothetical protein